MRVIKFKSKVNNNSIHISKKFEAEPINGDEKDVRVKIIVEEDLDSNDYKSIDSTFDVGKDLLESINRGLKDFEEGRIHSHESVRKLYSKYL